MHVVCADSVLMHLDWHRGIHTVYLILILISNLCTVLCIQKPSNSNRPLIGLYYLVKYLNVTYNTTKTFWLITELDTCQLQVNVSAGTIIGRGEPTSKQYFSCKLIS